MSSEVKRKEKKDERKFNSVEFGQVRNSLHLEPGATWAGTAQAMDPCCPIWASHRADLAHNASTKQKRRQRAFPTSPLVLNPS